MENKIVDFGSVHPDVKRYLDHDCYCPGEIYDFTGIWAMVYKADNKCTVIENDGKKTAVIMATPKNSKQIVTLWYDNDDGDNEDNHILNMERIDATENNIKVIHKYFAGTLEKGVDAFDEFIPGETQKSLERLLSFSSGFIIRD